MPPRLGALQRLATVQLFNPPTAARLLPVVQAANLSRREKLRKLRKMDPYRREQGEQRKNAHAQRREELQKQRALEWGHPIWGAPTPTPFVESLVSAGQQATSRFFEERTDSHDDEATTDTATSTEPGVGTAAELPPREVRKLPTSLHLRNYNVSEKELEEAIDYAYKLTKPKTSVISHALVGAPDGSHEENHENAKIALQRILAIENGNSKNRFHINVQRIVDEFGRHVTDGQLRPKPLGVTVPREPTPRAGPDTGSSEVQIAILTEKIRKLATFLQSESGRKDKHNRRNLRTLVHRRQKLLKYMKRKERGSERWQHMIDKLGLTPATWEGEITI
ncbi:hypothetical protein XA68_17123 [Ophiocordyceps unilateralis]|uniref:Ribosomal protein S15 n=1 Tax=Ophiocordyceps unilateralis TaxID=268505 RepID=A0A2A9P3K1_OPHUN|nr:hypothetical protein XA68_17123 [Ophiocordyceps unilateralis]